MSIFPQTIETNMTVPTLGTILEPVYDYNGVLPSTLIQNDNIDINSVRSQTAPLGFVPGQTFLSTLEAEILARETRDKTMFQEQQAMGVPKYAYSSFDNTSTNPTNFNWSTNPNRNLSQSTGDIAYRRGTSSWVSQTPSRSESRVAQGDIIMAQNTKLRSQRLY